MKCRIEFELPDNGTIFEKVKVESVKWTVWGYSGLAKVLPQEEWIPCSERLPSEQGQYLVTFPLSNGDPWVYVLSFCKGKFYETDDEWGDAEYDDVTAWMPLPEPWKGADDEID